MKAKLIKKIWVLPKENITPTEKYVLVYMAYKSNNLQEFRIYKENIAIDTLLDRRTIHRCIKSLVTKSFLIDTGEKKGKGIRNVAYRINLPKSVE